jgi:hypothetical protein
MVDKFFSDEVTIKSFRRVFYFTLIVGFTAQLASYFYEYVYAYPDSISRADIARRFYDSLTPGISQQLGTAWLPIPAVMLLPFTYFDFLWYTGLAGSIVNLTCFVITSLCIFLSVRLITEHRLSQYIAVFVFVINPNILYLQTTAMSEMILMMFMTSSVYYLLKWNVTGEKVWFIYSACLTALAVGSRYEGWTFALCIIIAVVLLCFGKNKTMVIRYSILYIAPTALFVGFWLYHNWSVYGDPIAFLRGEYSAGAWFEKGGRFNAKGDLLFSLVVYLNNIVQLIGTIPLLLFGVGVIIYFLVNKFRFSAITPYVFLISIPVTIYLIYAGSIIIEMPNIEPYGYYNARYGVFIIPGVAFFIGYLSYKIYEYRYYNNLPYYIGYFVLALIIPLSYYYNWPKGAPVIVETAFFNNSRPEINRASEFLRMNYRGGTIFYDGVNFSLKPWTKIDIKDRIYPESWEVGPKTLARPQDYASWILIDNKNPYYRLRDKIDPIILNRYYDLLYVDNGIEIYKRNAPIEPVTVDLNKKDEEEPLK